MNAEILPPDEARASKDRVYDDIVDKALLATLHVKSMDIEDAIDGLPPQSAGFGVHIGNGLVITAAHIYDSYTTPSVSVNRGVYSLGQPARVVYTNRQADIGILKIDGPVKLGKAEMAHKDLSIGQTVLSVVPGMDFAKPFSPTIILGQLFELVQAIIKI